MKTFNLKVLAAAALGLVLPALTYADHLHVTYNTAKPAACSIKYQYYDGYKNRVTCEYTDNSYRHASNDWVAFGNSGCEVRHVDHRESELRVITMSYQDNCFTSGSNGTIVGTNVGAVGAVKTAGNNQSSNAESFYGNTSLTSGEYVTDYLNANVGPGKFSKIDIQMMAKDGINLRVLLNKTTAGDLGGFNYVYFLLP